MIRGVTSLVKSNDWRVFDLDLDKKNSILTILPLTTYILLHALTLSNFPMNLFADKSVVDFNRKIRIVTSVQ